VPKGIPIRIIGGKVMCMKESKWSATQICAISLLLLGTLIDNSLAAPGDVDSDETGVPTAIGMQAEAFSMIR